MRGTLLCINSAVLCCCMSETAADNVGLVVKDVVATMDGDAICIQADDPMCRMGDDGQYYGISCIAHSMDIRIAVEGHTRGSWSILSKGYTQQLTSDISTPL